MKTMDESKPVLVTGATGYVAGVLIKALLERGCTVHAAVRNPNDDAKLRHLKALAQTKHGSIRFFKADLLQNASYAEAMQGCELVYHTASPFTLVAQDAQKNLIDPALLGTRNVLETACKTASVKRVVLTSSCAAIFGDNVDVQAAPGGVLTEAQWNTTSTLTHNPYSLSKTLAEKEAWRIADSQKQWDLVTINPSLVVGPGINPEATSESFNLMRKIGDGTMKAGVPRLSIGAVDVREVAFAHVQAGFTPEAKGRYIVSGHNTDFFAIAQILQAKFSHDYALPQRALPKWLLWLLGPIVDPSMTRTMVSRNVDVPWRADNRKSQIELGLQYRPLEESINDFFQQLADAGQIKKRRR